MSSYLRKDVKLWKHQEAMISFALKHKRVIMHASMGLGKTLAALETIHILDLNRVLVVCPKAVIRSVWVGDLKDLYPESPYHIIPLDKGTSKKKQALLNDAVAEGGHFVAVVNYETARLLDLESANFDLVVLDEAHKIGQYNSKQTLNLTKQLANVEYKILLTGTYYTDAYVKVYAPYRFLDPIIYAGRKHPACTMFGSYRDFLDRYAHTYEIRPNIPIIRGYKRVAELAEKLRYRMLLVEPDDLSIAHPDNLPPLYMHRHAVALGDGLKDVYEELDKENAVEVNDSLVFAANTLALATRLHMLATTGLLKDSENKVINLQEGLADRYALLKRLVEGSDNEPLVIFTRYNEDVEQLKHHLAGYSVSVLTGSEDTLQEWLDGNTQILIVNIAAGSVGLRLTRSATVIFWNNTYSRTDYVQAIGRVHRPGQTRPVNVHVIVSKGTIDEKIQDVLDKKFKKENELHDLVKSA